MGFALLNVVNSVFVSQTLLSLAAGGFVVDVGPGACTGVRGFVQASFICVLPGTIPHEGT